MILPAHLFSLRKQQEEEAERERELEAQRVEEARVAEEAIEVRSRDEVERQREEQELLAAQRKRTEEERMTKEEEERRERQKVCLENFGEYHKTCITIGELFTSIMLTNCGYLSEVGCYLKANLC